MLKAQALWTISRKPSRLLCTYQRPTARTPTTLSFFFRGIWRSHSDGTATKNAYTSKRAFTADTPRPSLIWRGPGQTFGPGFGAPTCGTHTMIKYSVSMEYAITFAKMPNHIATDVFGLTRRGNSRCRKSKTDIFAKKLARLPTIWMERSGCWICYKTGHGLKCAVRTPVPLLLRKSTSRTFQECGPRILLLSTT
jgi:hypothetical protein